MFPKTAMDKSILAKPPKSAWIPSLVKLFTATVVHIADQAEFTPRNVQTVEGRSSTFYAIKLKVEDPEGKLKIGMPADVVFK